MGPIATQLRESPLAIAALVASLAAVLFTLVGIYFTDEGPVVQFLPAEYLGSIADILDDLVGDLPLIAIPLAFGFTLLSVVLNVGSPALLLVALFAPDDKKRKTTLVSAFVLPLVCLFVDALFFSGFGDMFVARVVLYIVQLALVLACLFIGRDTRAVALIGVGVLSLVALVCFAAALPPFGNTPLSNWWWRSLSETLISIATWISTVCIIFTMQTPSFGGFHSEKLNELVSPLISAEPQMSQKKAEAVRVQAQTEAQAEVSDAISELKQYKELLDAGILTREEFDVKKKQLLGL